MDVESETPAKFIQRRERIRKSLNETMYLISATKNTDRSDWLFIVEGSRGTPYNIVIKESGMSCTCPFYKTRFNTCKHMFFILGRIAKMDLGHINTDSPKLNAFDIYPDLDNKLNSIMSSRSAGIVQDRPTPFRGPDGDCSICYESLETDTGPDSMCMLCHNYFHKSCIKHWLSNSSRKNCPLCRNVWPKKPTVSDSGSSDPLSKFKSLNI
jgi:hypothetical protein